MTQSNAPDNHENPNRMQSQGVNQPTGTAEVMATARSGFHNLSSEQIAAALQTLNQLQGAEPGMIASESRADPRSSLPRAPQDPTNGSTVQEVAPSRSGPSSGSFDELYDSLRTGSERVRKETTQTKKMNEYFVERVEQVGNRSRVKFICKQCGFVISAKKARERWFHIILCREIPFSTRLEWFMSSNDKDKPPLLAYPRRGISASEARRSSVKQHEDMLSSQRLHDLAANPSTNPNFCRYMLERQQKRKNTRIHECSTEETEMATKLLLEFIVDENIPFAVCDNRKRFPRALRKLLEFLRPGYDLPYGHLLGGKLLDDYYLAMKMDMKTMLSDLLLDGRATLMFDGSEDVNGAPMINVLLRVVGLDQLSTTTFFLTTIYTGYDTVDAEYYADMSERVVQLFFGFDKIAGVVTDNTGSVKNARNILERKYPRMVASQDQAHVADRLIHDVGDIPWVRDVLNKLTGISSTLRRFRKLRARLVMFMSDFNNSLRRREGDGTAEGRDGQSESREPNSETDLYERDEELSRVHIAQAGPPLSNMPEPENDPSAPEDSSEGDTATRTADGAPGDTARDVRTAVTLKKVSAVRFASHERVMDEFIRTHPVLQRLVNDHLFGQLYTARNAAERRKRAEAFTGPILDVQFLQRVKQCHAIFRACRAYLRVFDCEASIASEVFEATMILEDTLKKLPLAFFPEPREENRQELLDIFENRKSGPLPGRKRIQISLISDLHIAAALLDPYRTPRGVSEYMEAFRRHLEKYMSGLKMEDIGLMEEDRSRLYDEITTQYFAVRGIWLQSGIMRDRSVLQSGEVSECPPNPFAWWSMGAVITPTNPFQATAVRELKEFALRTLSVSPTATATERTFSLVDRIHPKQRASLSTEKVRKILFCQWNTRVLRHFAEMDEVDRKWAVEGRTEGMRKLLSVRSAVVSVVDEVARNGASENNDNTTNDQNNAATTGENQTDREPAPAVKPTNIVEAAGATATDATGTDGVRVAGRRSGAVEEVVPRRGMQQASGIQRLAHDGQLQREARDTVSNDITSQPVLPAPSSAPQPGNATDLGQSSALLSQIFKVVMDYTSRTQGIQQSGPTVPGIQQLGPTAPGIQQLPPRGLPNTTADVVSRPLGMPSITVDVVASPGSLSGASEQHGWRLQPSSGENEAMDTVLTNAADVENDNNAGEARPS